MKNSSIAWCDHTFNPWEGCTMWSPGCAHCYAHARNARFGGGTAPNWGKGKPRRRTSASNWNEPRRWNAACQENIDAGRPFIRPRVFCASLADWLDAEVPIEWLADLLYLIRQTPNLDWLLLTKRPENFKSRLEAVTEIDGQNLAWAWLRGIAPGNVMVGASMEDQLRADQRIGPLCNIPAKRRFISVEPMLEAIDLARACFNGTDSFGTMPGIDWVICGGESGSFARTFVVEWADDLRRQCERAGVPFFMKQLGANPVTSNANVLDWPEDTIFRDDLLDTEWAAGASIELADKKGGDIATFPTELRVREFPR